jgi:hypothetical protein
MPIAFNAYMVIAIQLYDLCLFFNLYCMRSERYHHEVGENSVMQFICNMATALPRRG